MARCLQCEERHLAALDVLAGNQPKECGFCKVTWEQLAERHPGENVPMVVHYVEGTYVLACKACDVQVVQLTRDIFKGTKFAQLRKL